MPVIITAPAANFTSDKLVDSTGLIITDGTNITGLTNGVDYRSCVLSAPSPIFQTAAAPTYSFLGSLGAGSPISTQTLSVDIGAAAADRFILVGCAVQNSDPDPTVVVAGTTLTKIAGGANAENQLWFYGGLVTSGTGAQNSVVTYTSANFETKVQAVWRLNGLASTTPKSIQIGAGGANFEPSVPVTKGDLVFYMLMGASIPGENLTGGTQVPARQAEIGTGTIRGYSADWTVANTSAAFNFGQTAGNSDRSKLVFA